MFMACWYHRRGARVTHPKLHPRPRIFFFFPFQLTPGLQAQSLRRNSGHENLLFSLSASGNTHSWLRLKLRAQPRRKKKIYTCSAYTNTQQTQFFCPGGPQILGLGLSQSQIHVHEHAAVRHRTWNVRQEQPSPSDSALRIWKPVLKETQYYSPSIRLTEVLLTKAKLLKCFQEPRQCYFLSIAVVYEER